MTNLEKIKEKFNKMSAKEMARAINMIDDACEYCIYEPSQCIEDCEWGIERYLKKGGEIDV